MNEGRSLTGMMMRQSIDGIVLKDMAGQVHAAKAAEIAKLEPVAQSLMPEGLLNDLDNAALRDLFVYLMK